MLGSLAVSRDATAPDAVKSQTAVPSADSFQREEEAKWAARLVAAGSLLTLLFEIAFLVLDHRALSLAHPAVLLFHALNLSLFLAAVLMALHLGPWTRSHWKAVALSFSTILIASSSCIAVVTREVQPLALALILFLAGTGPFLCWGERMQGLLSVVAVAAFAIVSQLVPESVDGYHWIALFVGAAIGLFSTALERRMRRSQRKAEEALRKSQQTLIEQEGMRIAGQLASGIAHDLNNTLNVMKLTITMLAGDQQVEAKYSTRLKMIDRTLEDASRIVARVRELGSSQVEADSDVVHLTEVIAQTIGFAAASIEGQLSSAGKRIRIVSHLPAILPIVRGMPAEIRQVFLNLLLNARDAMPNGGTITVESEVSPPFVTIRVSDEGEGIAAENLGRIFDPFFTTKGTQGTGLGLYIARKTLEEAGGSVTVENRSDRGAVFILQFAIAEPPAATAEQACQQSA